MQSVYFAPSHLDSPIVDTSLRVYDAYRAWAHDATLAEAPDVPTTVEALGLSPEFRTKTLASLQRVIEAARSHLPYRVELPPVLRPERYPAWYNVIPSVDLRETADLERAERVVAPVIECFDEWCCERSGIEYSPGVAPQASAEQRLYLARYRIYKRVVDKYVEARASGSRDPVRINEPEIRGVISSDLCIVWAPLAEQNVVVMTYEQLLMISDCCMCRYNASMAILYLYGPESTLHRRMEESTRWQEECLIRYGNLGFEIAKNTEALALTYLARSAGDVMSGPGDSYDDMIAKVEQKELDIREKLGLEASGSRPQSLATLYETTVLTGDPEPYVVTELFGIQKLCGHPLIDVRVSGQKARRIAKLPDETRPSALFDLSHQFCDSFVRGYISRYHKWPPISFSGRRTTLERLRNSDSLSFPEGAYPLTDWNYARLQKILDLEYYDDYLELIDDKSIAYLRSETHLAWDRGHASTERRLVLEILRRREFFPRAMVDAVEQGEVPDDHYVCVTVPKEKEFKTEARMFTMMSLEMRCFFALLEANIARGILPFFPEVTMTDSKQDVHERFLTTTRPNRRAVFGRVIATIDLASWNVRCRKGPVNAIGHQINRLFGLRRSFTFVHEFFERCMMVIRTAGLRPQTIERDTVVESDLVHFGHLGGLEGIAQKLWTVMTATRLRSGLRSMPVAYTLSEQGDNVVIVVSYRRRLEIPEHDDAHEVAREVIERCEKAMADIFHEIKPEECIVSESILSYSKVVYVRGVDYPLSVKSLMRLTPTSSLDFPSLSAFIASIFSGAVGAAESSKRPGRCYWLGLFHAAMYLIEACWGHGVYGPHLRPLLGAADDRAIRTMLITPAELGGLPIVGPYGFVYKGSGDPLSKSLASLKILQRGLSEARDVIGFALSDVAYAREPRLSALLADPYGLPIARPSSVGASVADASLGFVRATCANREINAALSYGSESFEAALIESLRTLRPFNPVIARDIIDASAVGTVTAIRKMFLQTRTLQTVARADDEENIVMTMLDAGASEAQWAIYLARSVRGYDGTFSSLYHFVESLRARWSTTCPVIEGVTSYLPIDFEVVSGLASTVPGIRSEMIPRSADILYTRGPNPAYLGSSTREKRSEHGYKIVGHGAAATAARTIQRIMSWSAAEENLEGLLDYVSLSRCGVRLSEIRPYVAGVLGGDVGHRYAARIGDRGSSPLGCSMASTHMTLDSDRAGFLSASTIDYPVMFQEYLSELIFLSAYAWDHARDEAPISFVIRIGDRPLIPLPSDRMRLLFPAAVGGIPPRIRLVCSDGVDLVRVSGAIDYAPLRTGCARAKSIRFAALVAELRRAGRVDSAIAGVLERTVTSIRPEIGLVELIGMGLSTFVDAAAICVIELRNATVRSSVHSNRISGVEIRASKRAAFLYAAFLSKHLRHPSLTKDPMSRLLTESTSPAYMDRSADERIVAGMILSRATRMLANGHSKYYRTPEVVFASDTGDALLAAVIRLLRKKALQAYRLGMVSIDDANFIVGSAILRLAREELDSETPKLDFFRRCLHSYDVMPRGRALVSENARALAVAIADGEHGSRIQTSGSSSAEVVRGYRGIMRREFLVESDRLPGPEVLTATLGEFVAVTIPRRAPSPLELAMFRYEASRGRAYDLCSGAADFYWPIRATFAGRKVVIVGCGLGAAAAAAYHGGSLEVIGHDLRSDLPVDTMTDAYLPPLVRLRGAGRGFRMSEACRSTSGDWFDASAADALLTESPADALIVLDIPSDRGRSFEVLLPLIRRRAIADVLVRTTGTVSELADLVGYARRAGTCRSVFQLFEFGGIVEAGILVSLAGTRGPRVWEAALPRSILRVERMRGKSCLQRLVLWLFAPGGISMAGTARGAAQIALDTTIMLRRYAQGRPSFDEWSDVIESAVAAEFLLRDSESDRREMIRRAVEYPFMYCVALGDNPIACTASLVRTLTRLAPRLIGNEDVRCMGDVELAV